MKDRNAKECKSESMGARCELFHGHQGRHVGSVRRGETLRIWDGSGGSAWPTCGARRSMHTGESGKPSRLKKDEQSVCMRPQNHDGEHRGFDPIGNHIACWKDDGAKGCTYVPRVGHDVARLLRGQDAKPAAKPNAAKKSAKSTKPARAPSKGPLILGYRRHPVAARWPMLDDDELAALAADIKANGQLRPIVLIDEAGETWILDGSNRGRACEIAGVEPIIEEYDGARDLESLKAFVRSHNRHRRHMSKSKLALLAAEEDEVTLPKGQRQVGKFAEVPTSKERAEQRDISERMLRHGETVHKKADPVVKQAVLDGRLAIDAAADLTRLPVAEQREIVERITSKGSGEAKTGHVRALVRQKARQGVIEKINANEVKPMGLAVGPFRLVLADPPWPYENGDDHEGSRGHMKYPPMPIDDICALRGQLEPLLHDDTILVMWLTNAFVPDAVRVVREWGFTWRTMGTWVKNKAGTGQWPRGRTEHYAIASRGNPVHTLNALTTWLGDRVIDVISGPDGHSRKPTPLHEAIEQHTPGPYLEMFARERFSDKWQLWGAETEKFAEKAA